MADVLTFTVVNDVTAQVGGALKLDWTLPVEPVTDARILRKLTDDISGPDDLFATNVFEAAASGLTFTDTGLVNGITYFYKIYLKSGGGYGLSAGVGGSAAPQDVVPPPPPTGLAGESGSNFFRLTWTRPASSDLAGFIVASGTQSGDFPDEVIVGDVEEHLLQNLPFNVNTYAAVKSFDFASPVNTSALTSEVSRLLTLTEVSNLAIVSDRFASAGGVLNLFWTLPTDPNVSAVNIYRSTVGPGDLGSLIDTVNVPFNVFSDTGLSNGTTYFYTLKTVDFSSPVNESTGVKSSATPAILFGASPPFAPKGLLIRDNVTEVDLRWAKNIETNVDHYEVHHATTLADLTASPTVVVLGDVTETTISALGPEDDFFAAVVAVDGAALESDLSNIVSRLIRDSRVKRNYVQQRAESREARLIFNTIHDVIRYEVDVDVVPTFDSVPQVIIRVPQIEDFVLIDAGPVFPIERRARQTWYWRVRPVYVGDIAGLFSTQVKRDLVLKGTVPVLLEPGKIFIESSVVVTAGGPPLTVDVDYTFTSPGFITRIPGGAISDGDTVQAVAEFENPVFVRSSQNTTSRRESVRHNRQIRYFCQRKQTRNF